MKQKGFNQQTLGFDHQRDSTIKGRQLSINTRYLIIDKYLIVKEG